MVTIILPSFSLESLIFPSLGGFWIEFFPEGRHQAGD